MPVRWRMPPVRWWFLAPGQDARVERRPTLGGRLAGPGPTGLAGPRWGGWGAFGSPGPGPGLPWCGRLPVEPAGLPPRHPGGICHCVCRRSHLRALLCPFRVEAAVVPAVVLSWGSRVLGGPRMFGARIFSMPASACGMGCCSPHTLLNIYMEEPYEHKRDHTHRCYTQAYHIGVKTGAHRHTLS